MNIPGACPAIFVLLLSMLYAGTVLAVERISVVGLFRDRAVVEIDGRRRVLAAGETSPEGVTLISATSQRAVLEINGEQETYALGTHIRSTFSEAQAPVTVAVAPDRQGTYRVNGSINGFQVNFVVDTGATLISMNRNIARRIGLDYRMEGRESITQTASGIDKVYLVELDQVRVGDIELHDIPAAVHDGDHPRVILLGNSFLNQVDMVREGPLLELRK